MVTKTLLKILDFVFIPTSFCRAMSHSLEDNKNPFLVNSGLYVYAAIGEMVRFGMYKYLP